MKNLTKEEIKHITKLSFLSLSEKEEELFAGQIGEILDFVAEINSMETEEVPLTSPVIHQKNVYREDKIKPCLSKEEALKNSPSSYRGYFKVKAIFDNE